MNQLTKAAYEYIDKSICVIGCNDDKRAFMAWKEYQNRRITKTEFDKWGSHPACLYIAIVCGKSSDNLEVIDIDTKYDTTGTLYADYLQAIRDNDQDLLNKLYIVQTVSGGYHIYYRCEKIEGNMKLANRPTTPEELAADPNDKIRVLIETRGQGGYVIAPPSKGYSVVVEKEIPNLTTDERDILLELARSFNQVIEPPSKEYRAKGYDIKEYGLSPFEDYNKRGDVVSLLTTHGWTVMRDNAAKIFFRRPGKTDNTTSGDLLKDKNWFSVFTTSSVFQPNKAYLPYAVFAVLECNGDFKEAAKQLLNKGYGERREYFGAGVERDLYKKKREGMDKGQMIDYVVKKHDKNRPEALELIEKMEQVWGDSIATFWDISDTGKLSISRSRLIDFLHYTGGFSLFYYNQETAIFRIVRSQDGFIEEVTTEHMKKFVKDYIDSLPDSFDGGVTGEDLKELILKGADAFFNKALLEFLNRSDFDFLKDTDTEAFFPFKNGVVKVTKTSIDLLTYKDIKKVIWRRQVIDAEILIESELEFPTVEYMDFIDCVCNREADRREYALSLIGYLLHQYKDPTTPFAVILAEETENESEGGGTGKGIFVKAICKIINAERVDGKNFKLDKSFAFQRVGLDTKMVCIEDVRKNVDFEGFYSIITEGITVEKKNKDELFIPYEDSPKIMFTTNYTMPNTGNHAKRRQRVLEFSNFFRPDFTPEDHFKHKLFNDWDKDEWNRFYNLMFICVQIYLENGVMELKNSHTIKRKQIKLNYTNEFFDWFDSYLLDGAKNWTLQADLYKEFLLENGFGEKDYSVKRFKSGMLAATEIFDCVLYEHRNKQANKAREVLVGKSKRSVIGLVKVGSRSEAEKDFIAIKNDHPVSPENEPF